MRAARRAPGGHTGGMKQLAFITFGQADYDPRLKQLLDESSIDPEEFESLEYFSMLPFMVLAGASVETRVESHGDHFHFQGVVIQVADDMVEPFFDAFPQLLAQLDDQDEDQVE